VNLKYLAIFLGCLLFISGSVSAIAFMPAPPLSRGDTLYVGGSGPGNYSKIQDAIDAADNGDTVFVYSGQYAENLIISKSISLVGEHTSTTIISQNESKTIIAIRSVADVNIRNFTIKKIQRGLIDGIHITDCTNITITNIRFISCHSALYFIDNEFISIHNNIFYNCSFGIQLIRVQNAIVHDNIISGNVYAYGLQLEYSKKITIRDNSISQFLYPLVIWDSILCLITRNNIFGSGHGIGGVSQSFFILYYRNYWNRPRILPKIIYRVFFPNPNNHWQFIPFLCIDLRPARLPYDIGGII